jgi:hypothetical protein
MGASTTSMQCPHATTPPPPAPASSPPLELPRLFTRHPPPHSPPPPPQLRALLPSGGLEQFDALRLQLRWHASVQLALAVVGLFFTFNYVTTFLAIGLAAVVYHYTQTLPHATTALVWKPAATCCCAPLHVFGLAVAILAAAGIEECIYVPVFVVTAVSQARSGGGVGNVWVSVMLFFTCVSCIVHAVYAIMALRNHQRLQALCLNAALRAAPVPVMSTTAGGATTIFVMAQPSAAVPVAMPVGTVGSDGVVTLSAPPPPVAVPVGVVRGPASGKNVDLDDPCDPAATGGGAMGVNAVPNARSPPQGAGGAPPPYNPHAPAFHSPGAPVPSVGPGVPVAVAAGGGWAVPQRPPPQPLFADASRMGPSGV